MTNTAEPLPYKAFGLHIYSEFPLPELPRTGGPSLLGAVSVTRGDLTGRWRDIPKLSSYLGISGREVMFEVPEVALFRVSDGCSIIVSPVDTADEDCIRLYILGSCMGILLIQRRTLALHGSAIVIGGRAYALAGHSGAGKSTLASYLMERGSRMISDDVIPVIASEEGPIAVPGYPQQKLWRHSLEQLGLNAADYRPLFRREAKFAVPVHELFHTEPLPLAGLFELAVKSEGPVTVEPISGMERFHTLFHHTYQKLMVDRLGVRDWHFKLVAGFVNRLPMYRLTRPEEGFSAPAQTSLILETIGAHGAHPAAKELSIHE